MAKRAITKERVTFSLDIELVQQFNKFIKSIECQKCFYRIYFKRANEYN